MEESKLKAFQVPMSEIFSDSDFNCRGAIAPIDVLDLIRSIERDGLQAPIVIQPIVHPKWKYRIVSGHRRHAAFRILKRECIDAIIVTGLTELQARTLNLVENLKRRDLNMLQEALAVKHFDDSGMIEEEIAKELGMSRGWIKVRLTILKLPPEIQQEIAAGFITQQQVLQLATLPLAQQYEAVRRIKTARLGGTTLKLKERKQRPLTKRERERAEIFAMQDTIRDTVGNNFGTRCLAWAAGEISDFELLRDLKDLAQEMGIEYQIPESIIEKVNASVS